MDHSRNQWGNKKHPETNENESIMVQNMGCCKSIYKWEFYSNTILPLETRKISNKQPNLATKTTRERINKT